MLALNEYMQREMWDANTGNFIRRTDIPKSQQKSDAWGITIVLEAYSYMVELGYMKPEALKQYYTSSTALYERTDGAHGARIIMRKGNGVYLGVDDDLQWIAALMHAYSATKDPIYLSEAKTTFTALVNLGMYSTTPRGWSWNSSDRRPNGVSTAYGALAAARLFAATKEQVYKSWIRESLDAIQGEMVGYFPRDMMVAVEAASIAYGISMQPDFLEFAERTAATARTQVAEIIKGSRPGERNPTDIGELAEGFYALAKVTNKPEYRADAERVLDFFFQHSTPASLKANGAYSRYDAKGKPVLTGNYLGVPLSAHYLPEVAELLKLSIIGFKEAK